MVLNKQGVFPEPTFPYLIKYSAKSGSYCEMCSVIPKSCRLFENKSFLLYL